MYIHALSEKAKYLWSHDMLRKHTHTYVSRGYLEPTQFGGAWLAAAGSRDLMYRTGCYLGIMWRSRDSGPLPPSESWGESEASPMIRVLIRARFGQPQHHTLARSIARVEKSTYSLSHTQRSPDQDGSEGRVVAKQNCYSQQLVLCATGQLLPAHGCTKANGAWRACTACKSPLALSCTDQGSLSCMADFSQHGCTRQTCTS